jgi:hypothetical protein
MLYQHKFCCSIQSHFKFGRYYLRPKTKKCLEDIDGFIRKNHPNDCGIIYCLSRMDCEKVAEKLRVISWNYKQFKPCTFIWKFNLLSKICVRYKYNLHCFSLMLQNASEGPLQNEPTWLLPSICKNMFSLSFSSSRQFTVHTTSNLVL